MPIHPEVLWAQRSSVDEAEKVQESYIANRDQTARTCTLTSHRAIVEHRLPYYQPSRCYRVQSAVRANGHQHLIQSQGWKVRDIHLLHFST